MKLQKAYAGFAEAARLGHQCVVSGNWGCGAFGGDPALKILIQCIAASAARLELVYIPREQVHIAAAIERYRELLSTPDWQLSVGDAFKRLKDSAAVALEHEGDYPLETALVKAGTD